MLKNPGARRDNSSVVKNSVALVKDWGLVPQYHIGWQM